ncbi:2-oxo-hepta-3-ene-1,7-dioic acid hydratase [Verticiella sediminum]|uniref:2-oxo-hepta-3-ene-1,7-dioic acid hydratase n=1 Tax=Verticiella sediminum TaxID=1247510 RepID=A0A556AJE3_9BURK|nr:2-oxo-hepta-3-ene-1,7-dioic acid hydratase [Verticiella sediminum]TSH92996.1 2-oxo-hepta-3-ene-1,7-dioic acid hydratase [Verticiella sediminum]
MTTERRLDAQTVEHLAQALDRAQASRRQIRQLALEHPDMTVADAYAVQRCWVTRQVEAGHRVIGHKIGLTSRAMQQASQIDEPDYGVLLDSMRFAEGGDIPVERFIAPRLEVELAFILDEPLRGPGVELWDVLRVTRYVVPALEIIDARSQQIDPDSGAPRTVRDTISDNAGNAGIVLGGRPVRPDALDLRRVGALLGRNGVIEETGLAAGVLNHPAAGVAWLANKLAAHGAFLEPGQIILAGSFTRPVPARAGDVFAVDYGELGWVNCRFV